MKFRIGTFILNIAIAVNALAANTESASIEEADTTLHLNEISVTAIKQGNDLNDMASASSLLNRHKLERLNVSSAKNISEIVPNFYIPDYGSRMTSSIYVRGIGTRIDQPAVGMNVDNVPILNKDNYDFNILDIQRVEMLRGPQSTLFGRNTMGGVINIYTLSPATYRGTRMLAEYGSGNSWRAALSHYGMINDSFGIGIAAGYYGSDGFFTNLYNGEKCDWERNWNGRLKLYYHPYKDLTVENVISASISRQGGYPYAYSGTGEINYNDTCFYRRNSINDGLTIKYSKRGISISSITSYQWLNDNMTLDQDFLPVPYFTLSQKRNEHAATQDFVLSNQNGNKYHWIFGFFGFFRHSDMNAPVTFLDDGISKLIESRRNDANPYYPIRWDNREFPLFSKFTTNNYGIAAYHKSEYSVGRWKFEAALRLDFEHSSLRYNSACNSSYTTYDNTGNAQPFTIVFKHSPVNINENGSLGKSFLQLLPKFAVTYKFSKSAKVYASISKGYKAGGFNTQMFSDVLQQKVMKLMGLSAKYDTDDIISYSPEHSWNYELGSHVESADNKISADLSVFFIDVRNQQLTTFPDGITTGRIMTNAGKSRSFGGEFAISYRPISALEINASYGYTNAKFTEYSNGINDYTGKFAPYAPRNTLYVGANYRIGIDCDWCRSIAISSRLRGVGKTYWNEENSAMQPMYFLLSASITFANSKYSFQFWGENLTDTNYDTFYFVSMGNTFTQRGKKLRLGATLRVNI